MGVYQKEKKLVHWLLFKGKKEKKKGGAFQKARRGCS